MKTTKYSIAQIYCPNQAIKMLVLTYINSKGYRFGADTTTNIENFFQAYNKDNKYVLVYKREKTIYHTDIPKDEFIKFKYDQIDHINIWLGATLQLEPEIKVGEYEVKFFNDGSIKVGCQPVSYKELDFIYKTATKKQLTNE